MQKNCPLCGTPMALRLNGKTNQYFYSCPNKDEHGRYTCNYTESYPLGRVAPPSNAAPAGEPDPVGVASASAMAAYQRMEDTAEECLAQLDCLTNKFNEVAPQLEELRDLVNQLSNIMEQTKK